MFTVAEVGRAGNTFLMRISRTRWAENFNLNGRQAWEQDALPPPAHWRHQFPPAPSAFPRLLPFLWLTSVSTTACSFRKRCSSHSTSWSFSSNHWNTQAQIFNGGDSYRHPAQHFLSSFLKNGLNYLKSLWEIQDSLGLLTHKTEGAGELRCTGLLTMSDSFILMVILLTASVALLNILRRPALLNVWVPTARGSYKTKKAGWHVICCPYFRFRRISIHQMVCPKLAKQIIWTVDCCFQRQLDTSITSTYRKKKIKGLCWTELAKFSASDIVCRNKWEYDCGQMVSRWDCLPS